MSAENTDTGDTTILSTTSATTRTTQINGFDDALNTTIGGNTIMEPREALITTAVNFLQNAKVRHTTLLQKQQFLRSKGLTGHEIQLACERAGVFSQDPNTVINMDISAQTHSQMALQQRATTATRLERIREFLNSVALLSGVAYAVYLFWKKYIEPYLFGKKKKKPIDDALEDINKNVNNRIDNVSKELDQLRDTLTTQSRDQTQQLNREFSNFRRDLEDIKGLLLNRKQFASPLTAVAAPPSIPAWQLASSSSPHRHHHHRHSQSDDNEKIDDAGSGSGSSETEVVTKNSDSSLEIM